MTPTGGQASGVHTLLAVDDLLDAVCQHLPLRDVLALLQADRAFHRVSKSNTSGIWRSLHARVRRDRCGSQAIRSISSGSGLLSHLRAQLHWRRGVAAASVLRLSGTGATAASSTSQAPPIQSLQFGPSCLTSTTTAAARLLAVGQGGNLRIARLTGSSGDDEEERLLGFRTLEDVFYVPDAHKGQPIHALKLSARGCVSAGADRSVRVFDWATQESYPFTESQASSVWALDLALDAHLIATGGYRWAGVHDTRTHPGGRPPLRLDAAHASWIRALQLLPGSHLLVTGSKDGKAAVWDLRKAGPGSGEVLSFSHEGAASGGDGDSGKEVRTLQVVAGDATEGQGRPRLVTGCHDGLVRAWDLATGALQELLCEMASPVECVQACGQRVVALDWRGSVACVPGRTAMDRLDDLLFGPPERVLFRRSSSSLSSSSSSSSSWYRLDTGPKGSSSHGATPSDDATAAGGDAAGERRGPEVLCMQYDDTDLLLGRRDGSLLRLAFDCLEPSSPSPSPRHDKEEGKESDEVSSSSRRSGHHGGGGFLVPPSLAPRWLLRGGRGREAAAAGVLAEYKPRWVKVN